MKKPLKIVSRIAEEIQRHRRFCVVGHQRPDGDCVGSQLALAAALEDQGREVLCWNHDPIPPKLRFLDPQGRFAQPCPGRSFDCVIAVDSASLDRLGDARDLVADRKILINIDHHASNTRFGDINWISPSEPSSGELVWRLLRGARWSITPGIADCLFTAISTDTGSFQYPTTRPSTYGIAGELVEKGADLARICGNVYQSHPLSRVRLLRLVYNRFKLKDGNRIAYFWLRPDDYHRTGASPDETEGLIDHIRDIDPVVVACLFEQMEPELVRVSLRSKDPGVDVSAVAGRFGGGGHRAAAGARIPGRPMAIQRRVVKAIREVLAGDGRPS